MADPWEEEALRAVELAAEGDGEFAFRCLRSAFLRSGASVLTTVEAQGDGSFRFGADAVVRDAVEVVDGDSLLHMLIRNGADARCVEACVELGADVMQPNGRGEHCLGMGRKRIARAGELRGRGVAARSRRPRARTRPSPSPRSSKARGRQKGTSSGLLRLGTPGSPAAKRRPASRRVKPRPRSAGARPKSAAARPVGEVDAWRRASGLAQRGGGGGGAARASPRTLGRRGTAARTSRASRASRSTRPRRCPAPATRASPRRASSPRRDDLGRALGERDGLIRSAEEIEKNAALSRQLRDCDAAAEAAAARVRMLKRAAAEAEVDKARARGGVARQRRPARQLEALGGSGSGCAGPPRDPFDVRFSLGLLRDAVSAKPTYDAELLKIGAAVDAALGRSAVVVLLAPIKSLGRAFSKVHEKYGGRYDGLTDLLRGTLQCDGLDALEAAAKLLGASAALEVIRVKNRLHASFDADAASGGYRDVLTNVKVGRVVAEVQLNLEAFVEIKEGSGHAVYEAARVIHFFDPLLKRHAGTPTSLTARALPRCEDDDDRPVCVADRVACGQLQEAREPRAAGAVAVRPALGALSGLRRLEVLEMEACGLSGPLALGDEADFPKLARLSLRGNELDGPIPAALGSRRRFPELAVLDLRRNALAGEPPAALLDDNALATLLLSDNRLEGPEPGLDDKGDRSRLSELSTERNAWAAAPERPFAAGVEAAAAAGLEPPAFTASGAGNADLDGDYYAARRQTALRVVERRGRRVRRGRGALGLGRARRRHGLRRRRRRRRPAAGGRRGLARHARGAPGAAADALSRAALRRRALDAVRVQRLRLGRLRHHGERRGEAAVPGDGRAGTCAGASEIRAAFAAPVHVRAVTVAPLDGWGATYLRNAALEVLDGDTWRAVARPSGGEERLAVDAVATDWRLAGSYLATSRLFFECDRTAGFRPEQVPSTAPCDDVAWELEVVDGEAGFGDDAPVRVSRVTVAALNRGSYGADETLADKLAGARLEVLLDDDETWETVAEVPDSGTWTKETTHHLEIDASGSVWRLRGKDVATSRFFFETNHKKGYKPAQILKGQPVDGKAWTLSVSNVYGSGSYGITSDDASKLLRKRRTRAPGRTAARRKSARPLRSRCASEESSSRRSTAGAARTCTTRLSKCASTTAPWLDLGKPSGAEERLEVDAIGTKFRLHGSYMATSRFYFQCDKKGQYAASRVPSTTPCDDVAWELELVDAVGSEADVESLLVQDHFAGVFLSGPDAAIVARFLHPVRVSRVTVAALDVMVEDSSIGSYQACRIDALADAKLEVLLDDDETWETVATVTNQGALLAQRETEYDRECPAMSPVVEDDCDEAERLELMSRPVEETLKVDASGSVWRLRGKDVATSRFFFETNHKKGYKPAQILKGQPVDGKAWTLSAPVRVSRCTVAVFNNGLHITLAARLEVLLGGDEAWETVAEVPDYETLIKAPRPTAHHMDLIEHTMQIDASGSLWRLSGRASQLLASS
ncbi:pyrophosphatase [Aureococcus anophagefferens]|nr:pyrophosphatase [Aureococcus anophagefferens]